MKSLPADALAAAQTIREADIVIGIPSYNNARTIGHVVHAASAGLAKYFPHARSVIINSDGGSTDSTRETVLAAQEDSSRLLLLDTPLTGVHRLSFPYHGIPGKGSAFRLIFQLAEAFGARACAVVDSDLRSITPEWIHLLLTPVIGGGHDFVAPYYHRHKYDGTITNSIVYPLTRALYGLSVRQPIGGEFGISAPLIRHYLEREDWETDVARFGIDIWLTTIAIAGGFRVCQSFLGAKLHDAKDPGADLTAMLQQVVGSVFLLMEQYEHVWMKMPEIRPAELYGFRYQVAVDPIAVNVERMVSAFCKGCLELAEIWSIALAPSTHHAVLELAGHCRNGSGFHFPDELWTRVVYDMACAYKREPLSRGHIVRSLTPLYLARVASFVELTREENAEQVEERVENLCRSFERMRPYLRNAWSADPHVARVTAAPREPARASMEV